MRRTALSIVAAVLFAPSIVSAETVLVARVEGRVLEHARLDRTFTRALRRAARRPGARVQGSARSFTELRSMAGCAIGQAACRRMLVGSLLVDEVVGCSVSRGMKDNLLRARISRLRADGEMASKVVVIRGKTANAQVASFRKQAAAFLRVDMAAEKKPAPVVVEPETEPDPVVVDLEPERERKTQPGVGDGGLVNVAEPTDPDPTPASETTSEPEPKDPLLIRSESDSGFGAVRRRTWIAFGAGVGLAAVAGVSLVVARGKQDDIDSAPVRSEADLIRLEEIEDGARLRYNIANVAAVAATGALVVGGVFMVLDLRDRDRGRVAVAPIRGGLSVSLGASW